MRPIREEVGAVGSKEVLSVDLSGVSVFIAMPAHRDIPPLTVFSLLETQRIAREHEVPLHILIEPGIASLETARSVCVHRFLRSNASRMFWIDSDIVWAPDDFMKMIALSTKVKVLVGSYPGKFEPLTFWLNTPGAVAMNEFGCIECESGGLGFAIMHREVVEAVVKDVPFAKQPFGDLAEIPIRDLFHTGVSEDGHKVSEDVMLFKEIKALGYDIWCDPRLELGHIGSKVYMGSLYNQTLQKQAAE